MIATAFGCVALLCVVSWPFFSDYRTVVKIQSAGAAAFALYFLMLGSPTAAIACVISCSQLLVSASVRDRYVVVCLYGASLIVLSFLSVVTWHGIPSALAFTGSSLRSEESSELQSLMRISYAVFCLKKKKKNITKTNTDKNR